MEANEALMEMRGIQDELASMPRVMQLGSKGAVERIARGHAVADELERATFYGDTDVAIARKRAAAAFRRLLKEAANLTESLRQMGL